eukprot:GFUD01040332.1.p1 GENE.GFUD01040332.1~~GFUD01040332.1.p1  ORF type:complete len:624 (-),score=130.43 GFUD01040332.1:77-1948(-)
MGSPEENPRVSVIHSRPSVICNSKMGEDLSDLDRFDHPYRYEHNDLLQHESEASHVSYFDKLDFRENERQERQMPNFNKDHLKRFYPQIVNSPFERSPSTSHEWNNPLHHSYLTNMAQEKNQNMAYLTSHHPKHKMPSNKISYREHPYKNQLRSPSDNFGSDTEVSSVTEKCQSPINYSISERYRKLSECSNASSSTTNKNNVALSESQKGIKIEGLADLKEKVGNKPVSNCHVCGDLAIAHMHYGGVCCYSCKAFFRRATQTGKDKKYKCKNDKQCSITFTNRRACQYCRFQKCLNIGMKPNWVLSDEQCNIRFRKVRKDKSVNNANDMPREGTNSIEIKTVVKEECPAVSKGLVMPFTNEEAKSIEFMVESYTLSKETFVFSEENDILWNKMFNKSQTERKKHDYTTFDLGSLIMTVIKKNIFFVKTNDKFDSIVESDKMALLQKNMSEMCHLRGAIRFDTKSKNFVWYFSKKDQLQMTFEKASGSKGSSSPGTSNDVSLKNALIGRQDMSKFYKDTTSQKIFGIVNKLCEIGLPMEVFLILINIVLFSSDNIILENKKEVENNQTYYMLFLHRYLNELFGKDSARMKLSQIMGVLVDLRELCERSKENELQRIRMKREQL